MIEPCPVGWPFRATLMRMRLPLSIPRSSSLICRPISAAKIECLLLKDCTGATDYGNYLSAIKMIKMQGGVFGSVFDSSSFIDVLRQ